MKKLLTLLTVSLLSLASTSLFAQNYYVCDTGNDSNSGLSESSPFKSYLKALQTFNKMSAGDSVLFCRGGKFPSVDRIVLLNENCNAFSVCTIADYGDENLDKPLIFVQGKYSFGGLAFGDTSYAGQDGGYTIKNLSLMSDKSVHDGIFIFGHQVDILIDNVHIEGFGNGIHLADTTKTVAVDNKIIRRLILKNSTIINNYSQGFLGGCTDCLVENNYFQNNGFDGGKFSHSIYVSSPIGGDITSNFTLRGNTMYQTAMMNGKCQGVPLVVHGKVENLIIENNIIKEDKDGFSNGCWGMGIGPGYESAEYFKNVLIRNNKLVNIGHIGITCGACINAVIENNTIIDESGVLTRGISVPVGEGNADDAKSKNVRISGNTILLSSNSGYGVSIGGENVIEVLNNTISRPVASTTPCIEKIDSNIETDTSSNICKTHISVSVIDTTSDEPEVALATTNTVTEDAASSEPATNTLTEDTTSSEPTTNTLTEDVTSREATTSILTESASTKSITSTSSVQQVDTIPTTNDSKSSTKAVNLGYYKGSRGKQSTGFKVNKCRAESSDGRCLLL